MGKKKHGQKRVNNSRVFVYGTLKEGHCNHRPLEESEFLGRTCIEGKYSLLDLGFYPAVCDNSTLEGDQQIFGEVYEVTQDTLYSLDLIEGHPSYYTRRKVSTPFGNAWVYFLPEDYLKRDYKRLAGVWEPSESEALFVEENSRKEATSNGS